MEIRILMKHALVLLAVTSMVLVFSTSCEDSSVKTSVTPSPTPTPTPTVAQVEDQFENEDDSVKSVIRAEARTAVANYVAERLPSFKLKGLSSELFSNNIFYIAADLEKDKKSVVATFSVRKFFAENGESYWRVYPLRASEQEKRDAIIYQQLLRELNATKSELEAKEDQLNSRDP